MNCQSCGLPMMIDSDHGGGRPDNLYCKYCTDASGSLKPRVEIREGMINLYMQSFGKTREEAEREVDGRMAQMPAWQASPAPAPSPEPVSPPASQPTAPVAEPVVPEQPTVPSSTELSTVPVAPSASEPSPTPTVQEPSSPPVGEQPSATEPPGQDTGADEEQI